MVEIQFVLLRSHVIHKAIILWRYHLRHSCLFWVIKVCVCLNVDRRNCHLERDPVFLLSLQRERIRSKHLKYYTNCRIEHLLTGSINWSQRPH